MGDTAKSEWEAFIDRDPPNSTSERLFNGTNAVRYGKGVYFALTSNYSDSYAHADAQGVKHMFICRVVVGEFCKGFHEKAPFKVRCEAR